MEPLPPLTEEERERSRWQLSVEGFGEEGQRRLRGASVLISRCGGVGSLVAYELAAAGIGRLVLAHGGNLRLNDLNRQLLMSHDGIGRSRVQQAAERLRAFNPTLTLETIDSNITEENVADLVGRVDLVVDCAPLFKERLLMNREAVQQRKPLVDCAMFELEAQLTTILPGRTPCLACLYPLPPVVWQREFPVFGAVAGMIGCMAAMEAIKLLSGLGNPLLGSLLLCDLRIMTFQRVTVHRRRDCPVCQTLWQKEAGTSS